MNLEGRQLGSSSVLEVSTFEMEFRTPERIAEPNVPKRERIRKCPPMTLNGVFPVLRAR
jgi:hypothetical protein